MKADNWIVREEDNKVSVIEKRRVVFNPKKHKWAWATRAIYRARVQSAEGEKEAWVTLAREVAPDDWQWITEEKL